MNYKQKQNVDQGLNINWFPGHMKKATDEILKIVKTIDLVIEVIDARAITSSSNYELKNLLNNKPILKIALKNDFANTKSENSDILFTSIKTKNIRTTIINAINDKLKSKYESSKRKGLLNPKFFLLVIGLPNVGKSTLINILKNKNVLSSQNFPGVTKRHTTVAINKNLSLVDTPGILLKHIDNIETAYKLVLINCIKKEVIQLDQVLEYGFNHYLKNHKQEFLAYYKLDNVDNYYDFMNQLCFKRKWLNSNNELDLNRFHTNIFNDFSQSKIAKTNFD